MPRRRRRRNAASERDLLQEESAAGAYARFRAAQAEARSAVGRFAQTKSFPLDTFQLEGAKHIENGQSVLVAAPTGAGKTVVGEFAVYLARERGQKVFYTTPIKALSNQKFLDFQCDYGAEEVGLLTGDVSVNPDASIVVMTTEVLRNMLYRNAELYDLGFVVLDEVHYLADRFRGPVWEEVILHLPEHVSVVSLSATVSNAEEFGDWLGQVRGGCEVVVSEKRPVRLWQHMMVGTRLFDLYPPSLLADEITEQTKVNPELNAFVDQAVSPSSSRARPGKRKPYHTRGERGLRPAPRPLVVQELQRRNLLPAIYFIFSRAACDDALRSMLSTGVFLTTEAEQDEIAEKVDAVLERVPPMDYAALGLHTIREALVRGVAAHHAGLLPMVKELIEGLFKAGLVKLVFATETLALGVNMPARTVVLESLRKWNGVEHVTLSPGEYTQLTGRAGRRGIDVEGHAVVLAREGAFPRQVAALASKRSYPLVSAFHPTYNMVANLLQQHSVDAAREILEQSFAQYQSDRSVVSLSRSLAKARRKSARLAADLECQYGDVQEYVSLKAALDEAKNAPLLTTPATSLARVRESFQDVKRGDIIAYEAQRRTNYAIVTREASVADAEPSIEVVTMASRARTLSVATAPEGVAKVARRRLSPEFKAKSANDRAKVQGALRAAARNHAKLPAEQRALDSRANQIAKLRTELGNHPVARCEDKDEHLHAASAWVKNERRVRELQREVASHTSSLARDFDRIRKVLAELGYLDQNDAPNQWGVMLSRIYSERDLTIAEILRHRVWDELTPIELAALVSAVVFEPRGDHAPAVALPGGTHSRVSLAWQQSREVEKRVHSAEARYAKVLTPTMEPGLMVAMHEWAAGVSLSTAMELADLPSGDFVRWVKMTIDLLEHLESASTTELAITAHEAIGLLKRGVVAWSNL
ncbi:DEAD/DEAH box helicase [Boudabousia marimammalium]|uniref:DEAD/DEAH box helicase n=1 Tax=Boudabousia marimammalium TaxID=156892 RepID=A0A1Q5PR92_9ACTO|nr:DEAD/DEAH box helicase [Boudabousia marimammalium]OKL49992.1 hypothetical protein BM477_03610 [Boudabousia marimammalium]